MPSPLITSTTELRIAELQAEVAQLREEIAAMEQRLREKRAKFRATFDSAAVGIALVGYSDSVLTARAFGPWAKEAWPRLSDGVVAEVERSP